MRRSPTAATSSAARISPPAFFTVKASGGGPEPLPAPGCYGPGAMPTGHTAYGYPGELNRKNGDDCSSRRPTAAPSGSTVSGTAIPPALTIDIRIEGFDAAGDTLLLVKGTPRHIADLFLLDRETGEERQLTHLNGWMDEVGLPELAELEVPSADGKVKIHGWVLKPAGYKEGETYPPSSTSTAAPSASTLSTGGLSSTTCRPEGCRRLVRPQRFGELREGI